MTPVNIFVTRDLPRPFAKFNIGKKNWHLHVDTNLDHSFCCIKVANIHHGIVWLFFSTFDLPGRYTTKDQFHGETFDIVYLGETKMEKGAIWKKFARISRKWTPESGISPYRIFQIILSEITDFVYSGEEASNILNETYNKSFSREIGHMAAKQSSKEEEYDIQVYPLKVDNEINDLQFLSGYEREMRFHVHGAWEYLVDPGIRSKHKHVYIAYLSKEKEDDELLPVGYVAALDGDDKDHGLAIPENCMTVISFAVHPRLRRKKVATLLLQRLFMETNKQIQIQVEFGNFETSLFLKSLGFKPPLISEDGEHLIFTEVEPERLIALN